MPEITTSSLELGQKKRLLIIFEKLMPLVDSLADKLKLCIILGVLVSTWLVVWVYFLKHFSIGISLAIGFATFLPTLVLARLWWALEELKSLPEIAGQMMGDAKAEFQQSVLNLRTGKIPKIGFLSAGKSLWSVGAMALETRELVGSYIGLSTLVNPIMLVLGVVSFLSVFLLFLVGVALAFFV